MAGGISLLSHELEKPYSTSAVIYSRLHCVEILKADVFHVIVAVNHSKVFEP